MKPTINVIRSQKLFKADASYIRWIDDVKKRLNSFQVKASVRVNEAMLEFYWGLGQDIVRLKAEQKWGSGVIEQMSLDLKSAFPKMKGFSTTNLWYVKKWFLFYAGKNLHQLGGVLPMPEKFGMVPWRHHVEIISKCKSMDEAQFYIQKTIDNGWSRSALENSIAANFYKKQGKAVTNFKSTLPALQGELARELLKDPYNFDFLTLNEDYKELELENALAQNISRFLLELGKGFSFVGRQVELRVDDDSFFIDMLFYHVRLKCYVVVELKTVKFVPEFAGKLNFYVTAVDKLLKQKDDKPTIGLLICKTKKNTLVEWALADIQKPIGVAGYELHNILPKEFSSALPTPQELKNQLKQIDLE